MDILSLERGYRLLLTIQNKHYVTDNILPSTVNNAFSYFNFALEVY